ncbi:AbrB/MazE/SpoVT family DNA-binding domain-containing protein [Pseudoduganella danionis]|uniref:SpoVT-AbrB domain-containing protein n=1 Tax=Pseudoduganella danionis TaxID=1890295 RepID=A0ABW9STC7_9BURK|nr:AbrB/MazE/SpoVT family DNA-binding domain-containing protein [Pseudoduganella danionis]MTW35272.1 hypothetical protein [Pseudoduganella danionis]
MEKIRLAEHQQLILPKSIIELAGLQAHDLLEVSYKDGNIILRPLRASPLPPPANDVMAFAGSCSGAWGNNAREIARTLQQDHTSWER